MENLTRKRSARATRWMTSALLGSLLVSASTTARAEVHFYKDARGVYHFSDGPRSGASRFRFRAPPPHRRYDALIVEYALRYDVDPALVKAVIHAESGFDRDAVSRRGAGGLMQLMPRTALSYGVSNLHDPRQNIHGGVRHLRRLLTRFGENVRFAVAAYNAGSTAVRRYRGLPPYPETRKYVRRVLDLFASYGREELADAAAASEAHSG